MRWVIVLVLLRSLASCAPTGGEQEVPQRAAADHRGGATEVSSTYSPAWSIGQTWGVHYDHFMVSMTDDDTPVPTSSEWRYEVVSHSDVGVVGIEITRLDERGRPRDSIVWHFEFHESGQVIRFYEHEMLNAGPRPLPLVPYVDEYVSERHLVPWWPRFPLVPDETWTYLGGDVTQTVTEVDGTLHVELRSTENGRTSVTTMAWEIGRPFWSRVEVRERNDGRDPGIPYHIRGQVVTWDRSSPWPVPEPHRWPYPELPGDATP